MKKFAIKLLFFCLPLSFPVVLYLSIDPFKVIYKYSEQINTKGKYQKAINRDFQSTELFFWNHKQYSYNSFIFGNSRSIFFQIKTWNRFILGEPFHFNAFDESIFGINGKLRLLDDLNIDIKNALIVLDQKTLSVTKNSSGHIFIKHPRVSKESYFSFHLEMFKGFFPKAMLPITDVVLFGGTTYIGEFGITENIWKHDMKSNQLSFYRFDQELAVNPDSYYSDKLSFFFQRDTIQKFSDPSIFNEQLVLLKNIKSIFASNGTNYKIIISPLYDQMRLNQKDVFILNELFGAENVFDFSGINSLTKDYHNYYEPSHFRPFICDSILNIIYKQDSLAR